MCLPFAMRVYSQNKLVLQEVIRQPYSERILITDCYMEPTILVPPTVYSIRSPSASFEMEWGHMVGKELELMTTPDLSLSIMLDLSVMFQTTTQSFSRIVGGV